MCMGVCLNACMGTTCIHCPWEPKRSVRCPGTGGRDGRELLCGAGNRKCSQPLASEPSLQPSRGVLSGIETCVFRLNAGSEMNVGLETRQPLSYKLRGKSQFSLL